MEKKPEKTEHQKQCLKNAAELRKLVKYIKESNAIP